MDQETLPPLFSGKTSRNNPFSFPLGIALCGCESQNTYSYPTTSLGLAEPRGLTGPQTGPVVFVNHEGPPKTELSCRRACKGAHGLIWARLVFHCLRAKMTYLTHSPYLHGYILGPAVG